MSNYSDVMELIRKLSSQELADVKQVLLAMPGVPGVFVPASQSFHRGMKVSFDAKSRGIITGVIAKMNAVNATVVTSGGQKWRVNPGLLKLAA